MPDDPHIRVSGLKMVFGERIIQEKLSFDIQRHDIFFIMGGSGCGKSTLMKHLIGLFRPAEGTICFEGKDLWGLAENERRALMQTFGISYQSGALISSMTLAENVAMPLELATELSREEIGEIVAVRLALVGLAGFEDYLPSEISGGMKRRAALARAMAADPKLLFFDEPSAGLDPITAKRVDDLILLLRDSLGATIVIVSHELPSIFAIANNSVFLDAETKTMLTSGDPKELLEHCEIPTVRSFLRRGED